MKKTIIILLLTLFFLSVPVLYFVILKKESRNQNTEASVFINGQEFKVELAISAEARAKGLGGRKKLCTECGMAFLFDIPGKYPFWMKDMQFPLDIIWIKERTVVFLAKNVPADHKEIITPSAEADIVLEINAGFAEKYGIKEGDGVIFE